MTLKPGFLQANFPATLLRSAVLAVGLIVLASPAPAHADSVTLSCRPDGGSESLTLRINYATGLVEQLGPSGNAYTNRIAPNARITDNAIVWSADLMDTGLQTPVPMRWEGAIDRLSGTGWAQWFREGNFMNRESFTCREATKSKF
jgi:hypothetical protein